MSTRPYITILGGGPAGLAIGYFAKKRGVSFTIHEATDRLGGNAITIQHGNFRFDTGAHRFHDKDPLVTQEIQGLLSDDLKELNVPSMILSHGKFINFPPSPLNLITHLGASMMLRAALEILSARLDRESVDGSFESYCVQKYGKTIADQFLLNYTEKLWGVSPRQLSSNISGARLRGLGIQSLVKETLLGDKAKVQHFDGAFYYPKSGYGMIVEKLAEFCGPKHIHLNSRVTRIFHDHNRVTGIGINNADHIEVKEVISTLPLPLLLNLMDPSPEEHILALAGELRFRNMIIVVIFLNREEITPYASIYFPDPNYPFTRLYEPKNRSAAMAPPTQTSLCAEIPCFDEDELWHKDDESLIDLVVSNLVQLDWIDRDEILDAQVVRLNHAYPILDLNSDEKIKSVFKYLGRLDNLKLMGRNGRHVYTHLHELIRFGMQLICEYPLEQSAA